ncbi:hypothetical protein CsSME_00035722 [Camellia sinensis var. sinensis]
MKMVVKIKTSIESKRGLYPRMKKKNGIKE